MPTIQWPPLSSVHTTGHPVAFTASRASSEAWRVVMLVRSKATSVGVAPVFDAVFAAISTHSPEPASSRNV